MKFHLISDIHLEISPFTLIKPDDANILILAGDIGNPTSNDYYDLIEKTSKLYKYVFIIKGNHECYGYDLQKTDEKISHIVDKFSNVFYLQQKIVDIEEDIRVVGVTLWSDIMDYQRSDIGCFISDFRLIKEWNIETNNHEHFKDVQFIKNEIKRAKDDNKKLIIITHHAPSYRGTSRPEHNGSSLSSAFCTDLEYLFNDPIKTWVFGHTHHSCKLSINNIPLLSNQRGYEDDEITLFDPLFTFEV
jgi:predicted phosphodiesterase